MGLAIEEVEAIVGDDEQAQSGDLDLPGRDGWRAELDSGRRSQPLRVELVDERP
jgi:hypothetical protein